MAKRVNGVGPVPCPILICGSEPGFQEDRTGVPFSGRTGEELDRFLDGERLPKRGDVYLTNLYREYKGKDGVQTAEDLARDELDLIDELRHVQPSLVVPMGREAARWFLGDIDIESVQGIPWRVPMFPGNLWLGRYRFRQEIPTIFPLVHPASAFHNPEMASYVVAGFAALADYLDGKLEPRALFDDPFAGRETYEEITSTFQLEAALCRLPRGGLLAIDTEGWPERPWSVQFSPEPGTGYLIRATHPELLARFRECLGKGGYRLVFHSALHDLSVGRQLRCFPDHFDFDDTMVASYLLQLTPQGLKPLCTRFAGMQMQSYDDIMGDVGQRLAVDYLTALKEIERVDYENWCKEAFWAEIDKGRRITKYPKLPKTALHKAVERCLRSEDSRTLWRDQVDTIQRAGCDLLGQIPEPTLDYIPISTAVHYGCRDSDGTTRIAPILKQRLQELGLSDVYALELATYPLIERMSYIGIQPNLRHFRTLSGRLGQELEQLQTQLETQSGVAGFNANSGDQVAAFLFDHLGLDSIKATSSGRGSTNDKVLEALEHEHPEYPVISTIREYRELFKLKSTFVDQLPTFVHRYPYDGRVHATFRTTRVVTGRLAASDPNLLAMPKHGKFAREFRRGWVAADTHVLCEWDLSQIELRVLAHLSQDPVLLGAFRHGDDLHARLAQRIFGGTDTDHKKGSTRLAAKAINFGIPMGMTCKGLSVELRKNGVDADEDDAQKWLDETMHLYAKVPEYQERMAAEAHANGFVRCLSGRIRYIGGIRSKGPTYEEARRFAFSTPIQEGAQLVMKTAEAKVWALLQDYWRQGRWVEPLIQIHDALTLECEDDPYLAQDLNRRMVQIMTTAPEGFTVPIETSGDWGHNWCTYDEKAKYSPSTPGNGDMKPFEEV